MYLALEIYILNSCETIIISNSFLFKCPERMKILHHTNIPIELLPFSSTLLLSTYILTYTLKTCRMQLKSVMELSAPIPKSDAVFLADQGFTQVQQTQYRGRHVCCAQYKVPPGNLIFQLWSAYLNTSAQ